MALDPNRISNLRDIATYIGEQAENIFVRVEIDGRWTTKCLAELDGKTACIEMGRLVALGRVPTVVKPLPSEPVLNLVKDPT